MTLISSRAISQQSSWSATITSKSNLCGLCLILDQDTLCIDPVAAAALAQGGGVTFFQYRSKNGTRRKLYETALRLARSLRTSGALFILNDHADIAAAVGADGVHLGQDDLPIAAARLILGPAALIGLSTHSLEQAEAAQAAGADYIGFGPIYRTITKDAGEVRGLEKLSVIAAAVSIPVIAIGGITRDTIDEVVRTGARGAAVISAVCAERDITAAAAELTEIMRTAGLHKQGGGR
jgi:thiamine-phosphate pyrophosphorylase